MLAKLKTISDSINKACEFLVVVAISILIIVLTIQVILRYGFSYSLSWADGVGRYMLVWSSFLGAAVAAKTSEHINLTFIQDLFKGNKKRIIIALTLICFIFMAVMVFISGIMVLKLVIPQKSDALPISIGWIYGAIPVSILIIIFQLLVNLLSLISDIINPDDIDNINEKENAL